MAKDKEIETTVYAKITDFTGLAKADYFEEHDQIESRLLNGNKTRVRKVLKALAIQPEYIFTAKVQEVKTEEEKEGGFTNSIEYSAPVDEEFFNTYIHIAEQRQIKTRYYFKNQSITLKLNEQIEPITLDNVGYEVDVYKTSGKASEWVKIDIELDPIIDYVSKQYPEIDSFNLKIRTVNLPLGLTDLIYKPKATEEQKAFVENLWKTEFASTQLS